MVALGEQGYENYLMDIQGLQRAAKIVGRELRLQLV
jgi:hypothetical protein